MRVMHPIVARTYDPNPQGSATTQVTMAAAIPFQRRVSIVTPGWRSAGVSGLGDDSTDSTDFAALTVAQDAQTAPDGSTFLQNVTNNPGVTQVSGQVAQPATGGSWSSIVSAMVNPLTAAGSTLLSAEVTKEANRITGKKAATTGLKPVGSSSNMLLIGGLVAFAGLGLYLFMRK